VGVVGSSPIAPTNGFSGEQRHDDANYHDSRMNPER
jgi:hypothetical protein